LGKKIQQGGKQPEKLGRIWKIGFWDKKKEVQLQIELIRHSGKSKVRLGLRVLVHWKEGES